ncbi:hypothetical protein Tco_0757606 [Tanacetum coccineum]
MGNAIVKLVKKVKKLEGFLKRRNLVLTDSEDEEPEAQGRKSQDDPQDSSIQGLVTLLQQTEDDVGAEKINTAGEINIACEINAAGEEVQYCYKGQREGKLLCWSMKETPKTLKEQNFYKEELAFQKQLEEKEKAQVQFDAQHYTNEDWDLIRAKLEANAELSKSMLGSELQGEDFAKRMVDLVNQRKKFFAEERAKAKRNKPMNQSHQFERFGEELQTKDSKKTERRWSMMNQRRMNHKKSEEGEQLMARKGMTTKVHCLNLESMEVYMLSERKYPLSAKLGRLVASRCKDLKTYYFEDRSSRQSSKAQDDMDAYHDEGIGDVIFGELFLREVGINASTDLAAKKSTKLVKYQSSGILCVIVVMLEYRRIYNTHPCS